VLGPLVAQLPPARRDRARQLFYYCLLNSIVVTHAAEFEKEFNRWVSVFREAGLA